MMFQRRSMMGIAPEEEMAASAGPPITVTAKPQGRRRGMFGRLGGWLASRDWERIGAAMRDDPSFLREVNDMRMAQAERARQEAEAEAERRAGKQQNETLRAAISQLPAEQQTLAWANPGPFIAAQAPMNEEERAALEFRNQQFAEQMRHNRVTESIDMTRATRENQQGLPTLSEARQWTNSYNDDIRSTMGDLGNMRAAIPYAQRVVQNRGAPPSGTNARMSDVALLRAAARAQTGPGVLTETEVIGTLTPSLQQDLMTGRSYADIAATRLRPEDRLALAQYVMQSARNASGDLWRRYGDAEGILTERGVQPNQVGISAPEYVHPDDMNAFMNFGPGDYVQGNHYAGPSGRVYQYLGDGRFRYSGRGEYDPSRRIDRPGGSANRNGAAQPAQRPQASGGLESMSDEELRALREQLARGR